MRLQLAINVKNLDAAIAFYTKLFGVPVNKRKPGYANFAIDQPPLKLVLFEAPDALNQLNHLGVETFDDAEVDAAAGRLQRAGLAPEIQRAEVCCFARQNKAIVHDPDGTMWEWYRVLQDSDTFFETGATAMGECTEQQRNERESP
jgi:catechol 2,3-dioxygenase-like lactoylglutathione lyase family enzyme